MKDTTNDGFESSDIYTNEKPESRPEDAELPKQENKTVLIERTAKRYKAWYSVGVLLIILSPVMGYALAKAIGEPLIILLAAFFPIGIGFIIIGITKFLAWWNHG